MCLNFNTLRGFFYFYQIDNVTLLSEVPTERESFELWLHWTRCEVESRDKVKHCSSTESGYTTRLVSRESARNRAMSLTKQKKMFFRMKIVVIFF